ncbi:hypothetical protein [Spirosoma koreense]
MAQNRYILTFKGNLPMPDNDLRLIRAQTRVVDSSRKALLIEADDEDAVADLGNKLSDWTVAKEGSYPIPSTRQTVRKPPDS